MAHMAPYRLPGPALEPPPSAKKRRKTASGAAAISTPQPIPTMQDLLPPAPTGFGDTVVASNPFDDTPTVQQNTNMISHHMMRGMGPPPGMGQMQMGIPSPMGGPMRSPNMGPMSPMHGMAPMGSPMSVHCGRPLSGGGGPMGSPMNPMVPPMGSPMNIGPQMHSPVLNGPMNNGPMGMNNNPINGPMGINSGPLGVSNSPMGMTSTQMNMNNISNGPMSGGHMNINNVGPINGPPMNINNNSMCINNSMGSMGSMNSGPMNGPMGNMPNGPMNINNNQMGMSSSPLGPRMNGPGTMGNNNSIMVPTSLNSNINSNQGSMQSNMGPMSTNSGPLSSGGPHNQMGMSPMGGNNSTPLSHGPSPQRSGPSPISSGPNSVGPSHNQIAGGPLSGNTIAGLRQSPLNVCPPIVSSGPNSLGHSVSVNNQTSSTVSMSQGHSMTSVPNSMNVSTAAGPVSMCNAASHASGGPVNSSGVINTHPNQMGPITNTSTMNVGNNMGSGPGPGGMMHSSGHGPMGSQNPMVCGGVSGGPGPMNHGGPPNTMGPPMNFMNSNQLGQGPHPGMGGSCGIGGPPSGPGSMIGAMGGHMGPGPGPGMGHIGPMGMYGSPVGAKSLSVTAGKIYPADQPMVFNPQNPNAPPIYPCGVCHKEVHDNDQAILCESGCNFWFHRSCTGLTEGAYQLLTAEVYAEWVCDKCLASKHIPLVKFKP